MLVPHEVAKAVFEYEVQGAQAWAKRHGWALTLALEELRLDIQFDHPKQDAGRLRLVGDFHDYKAVPPALEFVNVETGEPERQAWPAPGSRPGISSSIFHSSGVICAPFNRLAYKEHGGPHEDWNGPQNWLSVSQQVVRATAIGEMLATLDLHLAASPGRLS